MGTVYVAYARRAVKTLLLSLHTPRPSPVNPANEVFAMLDAAVRPVTVVGHSSS
jgi:hypothetical protein